MKTLNQTNQSFTLLIQKNILLIKKNKFMKKLILMSALIMLIFSSGVNDTFSQVTQEWAKSIAGPNLSGSTSNIVRGMTIDNSGNIIVTSEGHSSRYILTTKLNQAGDTLWRRTYYYIFDSGRPRNITTDQHGNIYVVGFVWAGNTNYSDYVTIKYNPNGDTLWTRRYNSPSSNADGGQFMGIKVDNTGNVYVSSHVLSTTTGYDVATVKYDQNGNLLWAKIFNAPSNQNNFYGGLDIDNSGNVFVSSYGLNTGTSNDIYTIKYNSSGDQIWLNRYNGPSNLSDQSISLKVDVNGFILVAGVTQVTSSNSDYFVIKIKPDGDTLWTRKYDGSCNSPDHARKVETDNSGNIYLTGAVSNCSGSGYVDLATVKYDSDGNRLWAVKYINTIIGGDLGGNDIKIDASGDVYITAGSTESRTALDFITIKYNSSGIQKWLMTYNSPVNGLDDSRFLAIDNSGNVFTGGTIATTLTDYQTAVVKYSQKNAQLTALIDGLYDSSADKMVQDTVKVYLRNIISPFALVDSSKSILDSAGKGAFIFHNITPGSSYYLVVKHRNSLETWSADPVTFSGTSVNYDFTSASNKAYGNNLIQKGNKYCIISGELDGDGYVDVSDMSIVENDFFNNLSGYINSDLNGDLILDATDLSIIANSASGGFGAMSPMIDAGLSMNGLRNGKYSVKNDISQEKSEVVTALKDNYPNPFNPSTMISYDLRTSGNVTVKIYDAVGKEVAVLVNEFKAPGSYNVKFDASHLSSGMYFYKLDANGFTQTKKMLLVK